MLINAFNDIRRIPLPEKEGIAGFDDLRRIAALQIGTGNRAFKADQSGIWLGADKWVDAPFSVDMAGNVIASSANFGQFLAKALANQVLAGSIIVGGSVDGKIFIKDSSNNIKVTLDQDGIAIDSGKLVIKDEDETTIIDAKGLVSTANFIFEGQSPSNGQITPAEYPSWTDLPNSSQTISLDRSANVFFFMSGEFWNNSIDIGCVRMIVDSTELGFSINAIDNDPEQVSFQAIQTLSSGNHTFKLQVAVATSGNDIVFQSVKKGYIVLGK